MSQSQTTEPNILDTPMAANDSGATTVRGYLLSLAREVWREGECFSGKRPFGNSSWEWDVYEALVEAGVLTATRDDDGDLDLSREESRRADALIIAAIDAWIGAS